MINLLKNSKTENVTYWYSIKTPDNYADNRGLSISLSIVFKASLILYKIALK